MVDISSSTAEPFGRYQVAAARREIESEIERPLARGDRDTTVIASVSGLAERGNRPQSMAEDVERLPGRESATWRLVGKFRKPGWRRGCRSPSGETWTVCY